MARKRLPFLRGTGSEEETYGEMLYAVLLFAGLVAAAFLLAWLFDRCIVRPLGLN